MIPSSRAAPLKVEPWARTPPVAGPEHWDRGGESAVTVPYGGPPSHCIMRTISDCVGRGDPSAQASTGFQTPTGESFSIASKPGLPVAHCNRRMPLLAELVSQTMIKASTVGTETVAAAHRPRENL